MPGCSIWARQFPLDAVSPVYCNGIMFTKSSFRSAARNFLGALLGLWVAATLQGQTFNRFTGSPGSKIKLEGTSSIHDWTMEGGIVGGFFELDSAFPTDPAATSGVTPGKVNARASARIPVRSIKSGKTRMDEVMQEHMKENDFPRIEYHLSEMVLKEAPSAPNAPLKFDAKGELAIAGVTNRVSMPVTMERLEAAKLKLSGSIGLKMADFKVEPVAIKIPALGAITTGNDVKVSFDWIVTRRNETASKPQ